MAGPEFASQLHVARICAWRAVEFQGRMDTTYDKSIADSGDSGELPGLARFSAHVGEKFDVVVPKGAGQLELVEARPLPAQGEAADEDGFSLVFKAAIDCTIGQGSVALDHEKIGWNVMYLIPIGEDEEGQYFEAIFN